MHLEIHDHEVDNSLTGRVSNIDYDYQAEQWIQEVCEPLGVPLFAQYAVLLDDDGIRARWTFYEDGSVALTKKSDRFQGQWQLNLKFYPKIPPKE